MPITVLEITVIENEGPTALIEVTTNVGQLRIRGECGPFDRDLIIDRAHIEGLSPGALGRQGLNALAQSITRSRIERMGGRRETEP